MLQGLRSNAALAVILAHFVIQVNGINYYSCKTQHYKARFLSEAGWVGGLVRVAEDGSLYASFRGVPYGAPPTGPRRFKELEPVKPWGKNKILDATEDGPACCQSNLIFGRIPLQVKGQSEDCLHVNVHAPYKSLPMPGFPWLDHRTGLPILVFIHGGAFQSGSGLTDALGPEYLMTKDVIVITFNFRIGFFGFFTLNHWTIPGNQGLRDMVTLLRWVQRNARAFGGDPSNVTLMGQSGGATSAHILSLSKAAKGLFKRVILMSCTAIPSYFTTSEKYAKKITKVFLKEVGINHTDPVLIHNELIKLPLLKIMHASSAVMFKTLIISFPLIKEKSFHGITRVLDDHPLNLIAQGRGREYPLLISYTNNEMAFAKWVVYEKNILSMLKQDPTGLISPRLMYTLPEGEVKEIAKRIDQRYYYRRTLNVDEVLNYYTDMFFKHPALKLAEWRAASCAAPTYMYKFSYEFGYSPIKAAHWLDYRGSAHMDDLACVFRVNSMLGNYISYPPKTKDDVMKYWMVHLITNFMNCSSPICNNKEVWPPISKESIRYNLISEPMRVRMMEPTASEKDMVKFFDSFDPRCRNITREFNLQWSLHKCFNSTS